MTLPSKAPKLNKNEVSSIENAVKDAGIQQIHPEKMEAFAEELVSRLKGAGKHYRTGSPLED
tara:strand:+ start:214 stop:399 length:186 start_codon:yes stop_codon:yes gene_type:complete